MKVSEVVMVALFMVFTEFLISSWALKAARRVAGDARVPAHRARDDVAARARPRHVDRVGPGRSRLQQLGDDVDRRPGAGGARRRLQRAAPVLERQHLLARAADDRLLGAPDAADAAGAAHLGGHRQHRPRLQPAVPLDVRALGRRDVSARARAHRPPAAAFVAGLAFAFAPYRISQYSHLQVLSSHWMPFVLLRPAPVLRHPAAARPLAGAAAALVAAEPLVRLLPAVLSAVRRGCTRSTRWRTARLLRDCARVASARASRRSSVSVCTWPFVSPYLELRKRGDVGVAIVRGDDASSRPTRTRCATAAAFVAPVGRGASAAFPQRRRRRLPGFHDSRARGRRGVAGASCARVRRGRRAGRDRRVAAGRRRRDRLRCCASISAALLVLFVARQPAVHGRRPAVPQHRSRCSSRCRVLPIAG